MTVDVRLTAAPSDGRTVLRITGVLDSRTVPALRLQLAHLLTTEPAGVVVDLTGCGFADASGPALLVWFERQARARGVSVHLVGIGADEAGYLFRLGLYGILTGTAVAADRAPRHARPRGTRHPDPARRGATTP